MFCGRKFISIFKITFSKGILATIKIGKAPTCINIKIVSFKNNGCRKGINGILILASFELWLADVNVHFWKIRVYCGSTLVIFHGLIDLSLKYLDISLIIMNISCIWFKLKGKIIKFDWFIKFSHRFQTLSLE